MDAPAAYLAVFSDYRALAWVLKNQRMAFGSRSVTSLIQIEVGSVLLLHTTTRCFRNSHGPATTGIIGKATVMSAFAGLPKAVRIGDLNLTRACQIRLDQLVPPANAVPLGEMADAMHAFQGMKGWRFKLMSPPVALDAHDFELIDGRMAKVADDPKKVANAYTSLVSSSP